MLYLEFARCFVHLVVAQMHHEGGQGVLSLLPHISVSVLQAGVELRDAQHQIPGGGPQGGQLLCQPAEHLRDEESQSDVFQLRVTNTWNIKLLFIPLFNHLGNNLTFNVNLSLDT